jgi:phospholipid/cholesterol/gamma-HCH transport system ATP-binding protein
VLNCLEVAVENVIELMKIDKRFGERAVLTGFDLSVRRGETYVLIGRSGTGKSTVLKHMAGLTKPDRGEVKVFGREVDALDDHELNELRKKIGFVFQYAALFDSLNVYENIAFRLLRDFRMPESQALRVAQEKLELVGLEPDLAFRLPSELSGGMRKRVGLARAIAVDPEVILYDEPTSGLDPVTSQAINLLILDMQKKLKVTSVVVTHDMQSAYQVADRIGMIYDGHIIHEGTSDETRGSTDPFVRQFVTGSVEGPMTAR